MPNIVYSRVIAVGNPKSISSLLQLIQVHNDIHDQTKYDLNVLFPNPLAKYKSQPEILSEEEYIAYVKEHENGLANNNGLPMTLAMSEQFKEKYGTDDWYEWAKINWGSKWGFFDFSILHNELITDKIQELCFEVKSAWCLPRKLIDKISQLHPGIEFRFVYHDESEEFAGEFDIKNGIVSHQIEVKGSACEAYVQRFYGYEN